jgi:osmotically-inducible protein OsmY
MRNCKYLAMALVALTPLAMSSFPVRAVDKKDNGKTIKDSEITSVIERRLWKNPATPSSQIDVRTDQGTVTLSGSADNLLAKERALEIVETLKGVRAVVNQIEVKPGTRTDEEVRKDIERALLMDPAADSYEVKTKVSGGVATLTGTVHSWQERRLSAEVAKGVKGLIDIKNGITVQYKSKRPDGQIEADVKRRLESDVWVDDALVTVAVNDGKVTLSGMVGSAAEKSRAYSDAWVAGVTAVESSGLKVDRWWSRGELRRYAATSDEEIKKAVQNAFLYDPRVHFFNPKVEVKNGTVTLTGVVDNLKASQAAEQDAENTRGAWRVKNYLKVRPVKSPSDADIAKNVKSALLWNPYVDRYQVRVSVYNGWTYLSGTVDSYYEKWFAEDVASRVSGVVDVKNNLRIEYDPAVGYSYYPYNSYYSRYPYRYYQYYLGSSDRAIKDDIEDELWWSPYVDADQVNVSVSDGVATLTGTVNSWQEQQTAVTNALKGGTKKVVNNLKVR